MSGHVLDAVVDNLLAGRDHYTERTRRAARRCIADAVACAAAGSRGPTYNRIAAAMGPMLGGRHEATVWFTGRQGSTAEAVYLNSTAVAADDLDDGHRGASGHPGGAVVPAVLGFAEATGYGGDLLEPVAFGYDAATAIAQGRATHRLPTTATGRWAAYGVAASLWAVSETEPDVLRRAMAHAGSLSPQRVRASAAATDGLKEGTAWATLAGLAAFQLARTRVDAPLHILDDHPDFDPGWFRPDTPSPAVENAYFKRYSCCRWMHPALDLIFELGRGGEMPNPVEIEAIEVETFARSMTLPNATRPPTLEAAHYSFPFCIALAVYAEHDDFLPLRPSVLTHEPVLALAERVRVREASQLTQQFPERTPVRLTITATDSRITRSLPTAVGDPSLPLGDDLLADKHAVLLRHDTEVRDEQLAVLHGAGPLTLADLTATVTATTERILDDAPR